MKKEDILPAIIFTGLILLLIFCIVAAVEFDKKEASRVNEYNLEIARLLAAKCGQ